MRDVVLNEAVTDKLSVLDATLESIEAKFEVPNGSEPREWVVAAARSFKQSRYNLASALWAYRETFPEHQTFPPQRGWTSAVSAIAAALGCTTRTVWRLLEDYERAQSVPRSLRDAMMLAGYDPAKKGNERLLSRVVAQIDSDVEPSPEQAADMVKRAIREIKADRISRQCDRSRKFARKGDYVATLREQIQRSLQDVPSDERTRVLLAAVNEVAFHMLGFLHSFTVEIIPTSTHSYEGSPAPLSAVVTPASTTNTSLPHLVM